MTDYHGARISFGKATGRHFGKIVSFLLLGIGFWMIPFQEKKQGLHDIMAGTLVLAEGNVADNPIGIPVSVTEKTCPMCAEKVKLEAKICRFCHFDFAQDEQMKATDLIKKEIESHFSKEDFADFDSKRKNQK